MADITRTRIVALLLIGTIVAAACGGPTGPVASDGSAAGSPAASSAADASSPPPGAVAAPEGIALVPFEDGANSPAMASAREVELVDELRRDAAMTELLDAAGVDGAVALAGLDAIQREFAAEALADAATWVDTGQVPVGGGDRLIGQLASVDGAPPVRPAEPTIDVSLYAQTGFTTAAFMSVLTGIVQRAGETASGTLPRQESFDRTEGGLRHQVDLSTTVTVATGGGKVTVDLTMSATDRISDPASGSFIALYTSTSTGHFDVVACPDPQGQAPGTYTFSTKHELNDVSAASAARSNAARSAEAPFTIFDGEDAHLVRIEAALDLEAEAAGPGSSSGSGASGAFDWGASESVGLVIQPGGATTATSGGATVTGTGGTGARGAMFLSSAMAQLFMAQVGAEAEKFWRSGECIKVEVDPPSRDVSPDEQVRLTATATHAFDGAAVDAPIKASLQGPKELDPADTPKDPPAEFTYTAGSEPGEKGTIQLTQTGVRGIGKTTVTYTVALPLVLTFDATTHTAPTPYTSTQRFRVTDLPVSSAGDGGAAPSGTGTLELQIGFSQGGATCAAENTLTVTNVTATAEPVPDTPERWRVRLEYPLNQSSRMTMTCEAEGQVGAGQIPVSPNTTLLLAGLEGPWEVTVGETTTVTVTPATGLTWQVTLTVTRPS